MGGSSNPNNRPGMPAIPINNANSVKFVKPFGSGGVGGGGGSFGSKIDNASSSSSSKFLFNNSPSTFDNFSFNSMNANSPAQLQAMREKTAQLARDMKADKLRSLTSNITQTLSNSSPILSNANIQLNCLSASAARKKSDKEIMALLDGRPLERKEVTQIRLAEQQAVTFQACAVHEESNKELKKV